MELNIQADHVHLLVRVSSKVSTSNINGRVKGANGVKVVHKIPAFEEEAVLGEPFPGKGILCGHS